MGNSFAQDLDQDFLFAIFVSDEFLIDVFNVSQCVNLLHLAQIVANFDNYIVPVDTGLGSISRITHRSNEQTFLPIEVKIGIAKL